jgi:hypothetical protein
MVVLLALNRVEEYIEQHLYHVLIVRGRFTLHTLEEVKQALRSNGVSVVKAEFEPGSGMGRTLIVNMHPVRINRRVEISEAVRKVRGIRETLFQS